VLLAVGVPLTDAQVLHFVLFVHLPWPWGLSETSSYQAVVAAELLVALHQEVTPFLQLDLALVDLVSWLEWIFDVESLYEDAPQMHSDHLE
jgi:hypothetical protein